MENASNEVQSFENKSEYKIVFIAIILQFTFAAFLRKLTDAGLLTGPTFFSWLACLGIFLTPAVLIVQKYRRPLKEFGITTVGFFTSLKKALGYCLIISILVTAFDRSGLTRGYFDLPLFISHFHSVEYLQTCAFYFLMSIFQESLSRGMMQSYIQKFLDDHRGHWSNLLNSLLFSTLHSHLKINALIGVFIFSLLLGEIYLRDRNIVGVSLIHFFFGTAAEGLGWI